jgi:hypothetical protein
MSIFTFLLLKTFKTEMTYLSLHHFRWRFHKWSRRPFGHEQMNHNNRENKRGNCPDEAHTPDVTSPLQVLKPFLPEI